MKKEKIYIFDLDHTIFNARDFKKDLNDILNLQDSERLSEEIWDLFKKKPEKINDILKNNIRKYLFKNNIEIIKKIKDKTVLLTWGDYDFQKAKINSLKLDSIFEHIFLTEKEKVHFLESYSNVNKNKEIYFFNDNYNKRFNENEKIKEALPQIKVFEIDNYSDDKKNIINTLKKVL